MQRYEIKNYFGKSYASTCQHCGITIYKRNKNGNGKHAWLAYSKAAYRADAEFEVLCRGCYAHGTNTAFSMDSFVSFFHSLATTAMIMIRRVLVKKAKFFLIINE